MKRRGRRILLLTFLLTMLGAMSALAGWTKSGGTWSYTDKSGRKLESIYYPAKKLGFVRSGRYWYCYRASGKQKKGWVSALGKRYYFKKTNGRMQRNRVLKLAGKYYHFETDGALTVNDWAGNTYYGSDGVRVTDCVLVLDGVRYVFGPTGTASVRTESGVPVEVSYFRDPQVDEETLLAAIIYCEAGNQPYYGQLAVGIVLTNRMRSSLFPGTMKENIYAIWQFEPARTGVLSGLLQTPSRITASCRQAAKQVLAMYRANQYRITGPGGKRINLKNYLFFMTPAAYQRLGLKAKTLTLQGHVFFKKWKR